MDDFIRPVKQPEQKPKKKKSFFIETVIIVVIIASLAIGFVAGYFTRGNSSKTTAKSNKTSLIDEAYEELNENWFNSTANEDVDIAHNAVSALALGLGDIHTEFWSAKEAATFNEGVDGNYVGIGVGYKVVSQGAMIMTVYDKSPAQDAGLHVGDIITKKEDVSLAGKEADEIKELIRGKSGTSVTISYLRKGKETEVSVKRADLDTSVVYEIRESNDKKFGYIQLTTFGTTTGKEVEVALQHFKEANLDTLVLDLRDNGGGYLTAAQDILNLFVKSGEVIYQMQSKDGPVQKTKATGDQKYNFVNGYILVNGSTASASELVSGALQELCNYKLVGSKTYGKGTAQTQKELSDGSILKYTYAKWMTPKGNWIDKQGLIPNIEVKEIDTSDITTTELKEEYQVDQVSDVVKSMQKMLKILGYEVDREDGYFSNQTKVALETFEKKQGLTVNGVYNNEDHLQLIAETMLFISDSKNDLQYAKLMELIK